MSMNMECFGLEELTQDDDTAMAFLAKAIREGTEIRGYSGIYFNKWYKSLQIIAGAKENEHGKMEAVSFNSHCTGPHVWKCRIKDVITPKDDTELDMRLLVGALDEDDPESEPITVIDVMNADVLPSYAPGEIIELQVIAKAGTISLYPDEEAYAAAESRKVMLPLGENGQKEEIDLTIDEGYPAPILFLKNHLTEAEEEEGSNYDCSEEDKWIGVRGKIDRLCVHYAVFGEKEEEKWMIPSATIETPFGKLEILFNVDWLNEEQEKMLETGHIISATCEIQGDALACEHERGMVINQKNNMMAVRYAFSSGKMKRLLPVMADNCRFYTENHQMEITGKDEIVKYLEKKYRVITEEVGCRTDTLYGILKNDDEETKEYGLKYKGGESCIAIYMDDKKVRGCSQLIFLEYDEEQKISGLYLSGDSRYRFASYESWVEMNEARQKE